MPLRMISYQNRIWDRFVEEHPGAPLAPVIAVLVSHVPGGWTAARAFKELFDPAVMALSGLIALVPRFSMIVDDLAQLSNDDLATRPLPAFPKLALWLLRDARDSARLVASFDAWIPSMLELDRTRSGRNSFAVLITYMFRVIDPMHQDALRAKLRKLGSYTEDVAMTIAEQLRKEGIKEGIKKGRINTLRSLLVFRFQTLGAKYEARLKTATPKTIDRYFQRLLTADSLAAVFED